MYFPLVLKHGTQEEGKAMYISLVLKRVPSLEQKATYFSPAMTSSVRREINEGC